LTIVVLDTSSVDTDRELQGKWIRALLQASRDEEEEVTLVFPEPVVAELVQHQRDAFAKARRQYRSAADVLSIEAVEPPSVQDVTDAYEAALLARIREAEAEIADMPAVTHEELLSRAVRKLQPFKGQDAGFRDALIWFTTLDAAEQGEDVAFVSNNLSDFWDTSSDPPTLGQALLRDLHERGLPMDAVTPYASIEEVVRAHVTQDPVTYTADAALKELSEEILDLVAGDHDSLTERLTEAISDGISDSTIALMSPAQPMFVEATSPVRVDWIEVEDVDRDESGNVFAYLNALADVTVSYALHATSPDGYSHSWQGTEDLRLAVPATVRVNPDTRAFEDVSVDEDVSWATVEDYEPMPW
jgi:hypothetical protein